MQNKILRTLISILFIIFSFPLFADTLSGWLPALNIIDRLEKKLNKIVLSSNQVLIWDTLKSLGKTEKVKGFGKLFLKN